jgi:hypothetical protein
MFIIAKLNAASTLTPEKYVHGWGTGSTASSLNYLLVGLAGCDGSGPSGVLMLLDKACVGGAKEKEKEDINGKRLSVRTSFSPCREAVVSQPDKKFGYK